MPIILHFYKNEKQCLAGLPNVEIRMSYDTERTIRQNFRNLIVAATGTGKTVIAAFDYRRFCREHPGQPTAELRLPEAIERGMLCPFHYFGVSDTIDLDGLRWENGG